MSTMYTSLSRAWQHPKELPGYKQRLLQLRREPVVVRAERPTRLDRARKLGYKAKQGVVIVRVRVEKGNRKTVKPAGGRKPKQKGRVYPLGKSLRAMAEEKAARSYPNTEVLNSYPVADDSVHAWFECIMLDRAHPVILADRRLASVAAQRGRAFRGLTVAHNRSRIR